jgi:hypothetical protein
MPEGSTVQKMRRSHLLPEEPDKEITERQFMDGLALGAWIRGYRGISGNIAGSC